MSASGRRVLMLCFAYPPAGGVGMVRSAKFAKYLPAKGYAPTVVTPVAASARITYSQEHGERPGVTVCRTPYQDIVTTIRGAVGFRRARGQAASPAVQAPASPRSGWRQSIGWLVHEVVTVPDDHIGWRRPALAAARDLFARAPFDVVYSTSPPETAHLVAHAIKREFGVPWVADLRDLWSDDHYRQRSAVKRRVLRAIERRTLAGADALVTVSDPWRRQLAERYETPARRVVCIPHGFDPDDYAPGVVPDARLFTITYTGTLHRTFQDPEPFLRTVGQLVADGTIDRARLQIDFHVFGENLPDLDALARRYALTGIVRRQPPLDYRACLAAQQASTVLLVLQWRSDAGAGNPPLKAYDYLGARRPMLVVGSGEGVLGPLMKDTGAGIVAPAATEIASALTAWYAEFAATGQVAWSGREDALRGCTREAQAGKLAALFDDLTRGAAARP